MSWQAYVNRHMRGRLQAEVAAAVDVSQTSISRWLSGKQAPSAAQAVQFARAVGDAPLNALVSAGLLTPDEAGQTPAAPVHLGGLTDDELLAEIAARLRRKAVVGDERDTPSMNVPATGTRPGPGDAGRSGDGHDAGPPPPSSSDASGDDIPVVRRARRKRPRTDTTSRRDTPHGTS